MKAFCDRRGVIKFGRSVPDGQLLVASAPAKFLRDEITASARHAYDGKTLLVPGVPEAETEDEALDALIRFCDWVAPRFTGKQVAA